MNGRVYDPVLGRFLSADPHVDSVVDSQSLNRYSYVSNNPLGYIDPSGYFKLKDALKIAAVVAIAVVTSGAALAAMGVGSGGILSALGAISQATFGQAIIAGAAGGFASGFAGSLINGGSIGDAFKAGVIGGIVGGISAGLFHGIGSTLQGMDNLGTLQREGLRAFGHGLVGGGMEEAMGGQFRHGFYAGTAASFGSFGIARYGSDWGVAGRTAAAAVVGGTASALGGGKFANGAVTGAFSHLFNQEMTRKKLRMNIAVDDGYADEKAGVAAIERVSAHFKSEFAKTLINADLEFTVSKVDLAPVSGSSYAMEPGFADYEKVSSIMAKLTAGGAIGVIVTDRVIISVHGGTKAGPVRGIALTKSGGFMINSSLATPNTFAHELGHLMGLPHSLKTPIMHVSTVSHPLPFDDYYRGQLERLLK
jgi:hypothetical protein